MPMIKFSDLKSVTAMQNMLDICGRFASDADMKFNVAKWVATRIVSRSKVKYAILQLCNRDLRNVDTVKYLGMYIRSSAKIFCNYVYCKLKFFRSNNASYSKCASAESELVCVLLLAYCLPVVMFAIEPTWPSKSVINILENMNSLSIIKTFNVNDLDLIGYVRENVGLYNMSDMCSF